MSIKEGKDEKDSPSFIHRLRYNKGVEIAILADVHSNLEALESVLADLKDVQEIWCLGDVRELEL